MPHLPCSPVGARCLARGVDTTTQLVAEAKAGQCGLPMGVVGCCGVSHLLDFPVAFPFPPLGPSVLEPDLRGRGGAEAWRPLPVPAGRVVACGAPPSSPSPAKAADSLHGGERRKFPHVQLWTASGSPDVFSSKRTEMAHLSWKRSSPAPRVVIFSPL